MLSELSIKEKLFIEHLLKQECRENKPANIFSQILLFLGGGILVYAIYYVGTHFRQTAMPEITILLLMMGFASIGFSLFLKRIFDLSHDLCLMWNIIHKLTKINHMLEPGTDNHPHIQF